MLLYDPVVCRVLSSLSPMPLLLSSGTYHRPRKKIEKYDKDTQRYMVTPILGEIK